MPIAVIAAVAIGVVLVMRAASARSERHVVTEYVTAWAAGDYSHMYSMLDPASKPTISERKFAAAYRRDAMTATVQKLTAERVGHRQGDFIPVQMLVSTKLFGDLRETLEVPLSGSGSSATVHYTSSLLFPGLQGRERLGRHMSLPPRATLFAADGTPLAEGPDRTSPIPDVAAQITGVLGPIPAADAATYTADGYPADAQRWYRRARARVPDPARGDARWRAAAPASGCWREPSPNGATTSPPRSCPRSRPPRSPPSAAATPGSRRWTREPARCWRSPGSRSPPPSRPGRR